MSGDGLPDERIAEILESSRVIAAVGMTKKSRQPSYEVPLFLARAGYRVIPVNPSTRSIAGMRSYKSLLDVPARVDIVYVLRGTGSLAELVEQAVAKEARVFWLHEGLYDEEAVALAREVGMTVVWDRCMMREYKRLVKRRLRPWSSSSGLVV